MILVTEFTRLCSHRVFYFFPEDLTLHFQILPTKRITLNVEVYLTHFIYQQFIYDHLGKVKDPICIDVIGSIKIPPMERRKG